MNFNNIINECLNYFIMIGNKLVCKPIVKFKVFLGSLIKKSARPFEIIHFLYIKFWVFYTWHAFPPSFNNTLEKVESASSASCNYSKKV